MGINPSWVVDPGPSDRGHIERLREAGTMRGGIEGVVLTHSHSDHSGGVDLLGFEPARLEDGMKLGPLTAVATPGHSDDHFVFMTEDGVCFSGDLVLGIGSSFVPPDGGSLAAYMDSLVRVRDLAPTLIAPGHGPCVTDPVEKLEEYIEHRQARERSLLESIEGGERSRTALLAEVWSDVPENLRPAAALVMEAHIEKLVTEGRLEGDLDE